MNLLFDENLSNRLVRQLDDLFPGSTHVRDIGFKSANDPTIWDHGKINDLVIVSKDVDMHDLSLVQGNPPKVIWIRLGNCSTRQVEQLIRREFESIKNFIADHSVSLLSLP